VKWIKDDSKEEYKFGGKKFSKSFVPFLFKLANTLSVSEDLREHLNSNKEWKKFEGKELQDRMKKENVNLGRFESDDKKDEKSEIIDPSEGDNVEELKTEKEDTANIKSKSHSVIVSSSKHKFDKETKEESDIANWNRTAFYSKQPDEPALPMLEVPKYAFPLRKPKSPLSLGEPPESFWLAVNSKKYSQSAVISKPSLDSSIGKKTGS